MGNSIAVADVVGPEVDVPFAAPMPQAGGAKTPPARIAAERAFLLQRLGAAELAREFVEAYVTAENIDSLADDPIVRRLHQLMGYFDAEVQQLHGDAQRFGWEPPVGSQLDGGVSARP